MANTSLSDVATKVAITAGNETYISALGDGTAKPGDAVGLTSAGKVVQTDVGASESFVGFLVANRSDSVTIDTAIADGTPCDIVVPKSGHIYAVHIEDPAGTKYEGTPYTFSDTAGAMESAAAVIDGLATLAAQVDNEDTYGKIRWR